MEIKVRLSGDIRDWDSIPLSMVTRELEPSERRELLGKLRQWAKTEFVVSIQVKDDAQSNSIYFENQLPYENDKGSFFRWLDYKNMGN